MKWLRDDCPQCDAPLVSSRFDAAFRMPDATERLCFAVPAALCKACQQLYLDPELIAQLEVTYGRCVFAIESDVMALQRASNLPL